MHTDHKMIVHIFTSEYGYKSYIHYFSLRKNRKKHSLSLHPMSVVELVAEQKNNASLEYIKEVQLIHTSNPYEFDVLKSSVVQFLNEILLKILCQCGCDEDMYLYIENSLVNFQHKEFSPDFHLRFLLHLTKYFGCFPENNYSEKYKTFNCQTACFDDNGSNPAETEISAWIHILLNQELFSNDKELKPPYHLRNKILQSILSYYTMHISNVKGLKSLEVLNVILR